MPIMLNPMSNKLGSREGMNFCAISMTIPNDKATNGAVYGWRRDKTLERDRLNRE